MPQIRFYCTLILPFFLLNTVFGQIIIQEKFAVVEILNGLESATSMAFFPDGRILITEQDGRILIVKNDKLLNQPIYKIQVETGDDKGLMGCAIDPEFSSNGFIYLYHTLPDGSANKISRLKMQGDAILEGSQTTILLLDPLKANWHNGGSMKFGLDGKLYVGVGDNSQGSPTAQNLDSYWGKLLRINKDGSVPFGNPYTSGSEQRKRVWAYGLRNPYTLDIHENKGTIFLNDVGGAKWEEINDATLPNRNFGWAEAEGIDETNTYFNPEHTYSHTLKDQDGKNIYTDSTGNSIVGGAFLDKPNNYPSKYQNKYFFSNLSGWVNVITPGVKGTRETFAVLAKYGYGLTYLTQGNDGNLYFFNRSEGSLNKFVYVNTHKPVIVSQPKNLSLAAGQQGSLSVVAIGDATLTYQWQKDGVNIPNAKKANYTFTATEALSGNYRCVVCNSLGCDTSSKAIVTVTHYNNPPKTFILAPHLNFLYAGGDKISFMGDAFDNEDGVLPKSNFTWRLDFHHNDHIHPSGIIANGVKSGSFTISNVGELAADVFYRLTLEVTDNMGLKSSSYVDLQPKLAKITFKTSPRGLLINFDGPNKATPYTVNSVEGMRADIDAPVLQVNPSNGEYYYIDNWGEEESPSFTTPLPQGSTNFTANFRKFWRNVNSDLGEEIENGVYYKYYNNNRNNLRFSLLTPSQTGTIATISLSEINEALDQKMGVKMTSYFDAPEDGLYKFFINSNGKASLAIKNWPQKDIVVRNENKAGPAIDGFGVIGLKKGKHQLEIRYANIKDETPVLNVQVEGPGLDKQDIPSANLFIKSKNTGREEDPDQTVLGNESNDDLKLKSEELLIIYPNPASQVINLNYLSSVYEMVKIEITDLSGRTLHQKDYAVNQGLNNIEIATSLVSVNGFVILKLIASSRSFSKSIIIQK